MTTELTNSKIVNLPSGAVLEMTLAPFKDGFRLTQALAACLKPVKIDASRDIEDINNFKDVILAAITSPEVQAALLECLKRCAYNKERVISWDFFDDVSRRVDYFEICWEVATFNVAPFTKNLLTKFGEIAQKVGAQKTGQK